MKIGLGIFCYLLGFYIPLRSGQMGLRKLHKEFFNPSIWSFQMIRTKSGLFKMIWAFLNVFVGIPIMGFFLFLVSAVVPSIIGLPLIALLAAHETTKSFQGVGYGAYVIFLLMGLEGFAQVLNED